MLGFSKFDGSVAGEECAAFDRPGAGTLALGARLRPVNGARWFGGRIVAELSSDLEADVVGTLFDGGEIEVVEGFVGAEEIEGNRFEDLLEARVKLGVIR